MRDDRAQSELDHLGSERMATDWGTRIISNESKLYDPLSYHNGSVWPLFTGWTSMAAYAYGRPQVGYQALMANALLTYSSALGYVTELLSGDFNAPFGRSSHHQVWSEAMVVTPTVRGLLGIEASGGGKDLHFAPQLPANWDQVEARNITVGNMTYDVNLGRVAGRMTITIKRSGSHELTAADKLQLTVAPSFPLDARVRAVTVRGRKAGFEISRTGDAQRASVSFDVASESVEIVFRYDEGTDVYIEPEMLAPGARSQGLRILRSSADVAGLRLVLEGLGGRSYALLARGPRQLAETAGVRVRTNSGSNQELLVQFEGPPETYVRRELMIPFLKKVK
jgi:hypothetical protein